jgi:non-ribosomal peptide synthetase component E (peptide arylation enzyme)
MLCYLLLLLLQVDVTAMVPTVVVGLLQHLATHNTALRSLRRLVIGGAAAPRSMIETLERWVSVISIPACVDEHTRKHASVYTSQ